MRNLKTSLLTNREPVPPDKPHIRPAFSFVKVEALLYTRPINGDVVEASPHPANFP